MSFARDAAFFERASLAAGVRRCETVAVKRTDAAGQATLATSKMQVRVDLATGRLAFLDAAGRPVLAEKPGGRGLEPAEVQGERTFHVRQQWLENADESLYGLGQHQLGLVDIKGYDLDLWQHNGTVDRAVPRLEPGLRHPLGQHLLHALRRPARVGADPGRPALRRGRQARRAHRLLLRRRGLRAGWSRTRVDAKIDVAIPGAAKQPNLAHPPRAAGRGPGQRALGGRRRGRRSRATTCSSSSRTAASSIWVDGKLVADHWRQGWLPWNDLARVTLAKGRHALRLEWSKDQGMETVQLLWKTPATERATSLWSEVGDGIDYYFVYGPELDRVVAGYRRLTGQAPMMPRWAFGLWQSRQRYETQQQSLDVVDGFRSRGIPFDNIVQDWFYWQENAWGSHRFDPQRFPDPDGWVRAIHDRHARLMISVWGKFYPGTENFEAMRAKGFLYEPPLKAGYKDWVGPGYPYTFYDAFNPEARAALLVAGQPGPLPQRHGRVVDGRDGAGPPAHARRSTGSARTCTRPPWAAARACSTPTRCRTARASTRGSGRRRPDQRVFILTRSGFAGQQRYAAATWSGDITSTWTRDAQADRGRPGVLHLGPPVLDDGHRRLRGARPLLAPRPVAGGRRGVARAQHPLVPVRRRSSRCSASTARRRSARCGRWAASRTRPTRLT